jgi:hypothetical protein
LVYGGTRQVIVGHVLELDHTVLQLDGKPLTEELSILHIHVLMVGPILGKGGKLLSVVVRGVVPLLKANKLLQLLAELALT